MRSARWCDLEQRALRGLSMLAQVLYLRVFRWRMDYSTGISGGPGNKITMTAILEEVGFIPDPRSTKKAWAPTRSEVRAAIAELERPRDLDGEGNPVALLVDHGSNADFGYIKRHVLADWDGSVKNMSDQSATRERPGPRPISDPMSNPANASQNADFENDYDSNHSISDQMNAVAKNQHYTDQPSRATRPPESEIREKSVVERERYSTRARDATASRLSLSELPADWAAWATVERPDLDVSRCWADFADYQSEQNRTSADWAATWRRWIRREKPTEARRNERHDIHERRRRANAGWDEAARRAEALERGDSGAVVLPLRRDLAAGLG